MASHGYIVAATNHPPDSLIAVYPDGHTIKEAPYWPVDADRRTQGVAIGKFAEDVLVADVEFVLDQLQELNTHDEFWKGHLDLSRIAIVGHSMGGTTAALAASGDKRIRIGVNLDGSTYPGMNGDVRPVPVHKPLLFMETEEHASDSTTHGKEYVGGKGETYYVVVAGNDHMGFTDARLIQNRFSLEPSPSDRPTSEQAASTLEVTQTIVDEFLGKYLKGRPGPEMDGLIRVDKE
jgi:pimeloyl-ACP methyl ester carboxylesterase